MGVLRSAKETSSTWACDFWEAYSSISVLLWLGLTQMHSEYLHKDPGYFMEENEANKRLANVC